MSKFVTWTPDPWSDDLIGHMGGILVFSLTPSPMLQGDTSCDLSCRLPNERGGALGSGRVDSMEAGKVKAEEIVKQWLVACGLAVEETGS